MSDTGSRKDVERMLGEAELENLRLIFDRDREILSDEDYARLAALVEDESDANDLVTDHDFSCEPGR